MCPPLGHSGARIGPALLMRRAQGRSGGEVRPTGEWRGPRRVEMVLLISRVGNIKSRGREGESRRAQQAADQVPDDVVCETMARVQTRPALLKLLGCGLSPTQPYPTNFVFMTPSDQNPSVSLLLPISDPAVAQQSHLLILSSTTAILDIDSICF
jgi:hypothetical protein